MSSYTSSATGTTLTGLTTLGAISVTPLHPAACQLWVARAAGRAEVHQHGAAGVPQGGRRSTALKAGRPE